MRKFLSKGFFIGIMSLACFGATAKDYEVIIPKKIKYNNSLYIYQSEFDAKKITAKGNIDSEPDEEILVVFPTYPKTADKVKPPVYFFRIYKFDKGSQKYKVLKTTKLSDCPSKIILKDFNHDGASEIALFFKRRVHYEHIYIYQLKGSNLELLWDKGSYCGIEIDFSASEPLIKAASSNLGAKIKDDKNQEVYWCYAAEPLWEVYSWNGQTFAYRKDLSTTSLLGRPK